MKLINLPHELHEEVPVIIQDFKTLKVLGLVWIDNKTLNLSLETEKLHFVRTEDELKGNVFKIRTLQFSGNQKTVLVLVKNKENYTGLAGNEELINSLYLEKVVNTFRNYKEDKDSKTSKSMQRGLNKLAQKFGEEAFELVIEAKENNPQAFRGEAADVMYYYLALLAAKKESLPKIIEELKKRI